MKRHNESAQRAENELRQGRISLWLPRTSQERLQRADVLLLRQCKITVFFVEVHRNPPRDSAAYNAVMLAAIQRKFGLSFEQLRDRAALQSDDLLRAATAEAQRDVQQGKLGLRTGGLMQPARGRVTAKDVLRRDYGIDDKLCFGCLVDAQLLAEVKAYNAVMEKAILAKFGKSYSALYAEAEKAALNAAR